MASDRFFPHHHDAVVPLTGAGPVGELGHVFAPQPNVLETAFPNDPFLDLVGTLAGLGGHLVSGLTLQNCPAVRLQRIGPRHQVRPRVDTEDEVHALAVPSIQMPGLAEVGVPAQQDPMEPGALAPPDRLIEPRGRAFMRGPVAAPVHQV